MKRAFQINFRNRSGSVTAVRISVASLLILIFAVSAQGLETSQVPVRDSTGLCHEGCGQKIATMDFSGLGTTRTDVVTRELRNRVGQVFSCTAWEEERERLQDLDIFADITLKTEMQNGGLVLHYIFRELPPYIPFIAISKTEQDGFSMGPALASLNFLGLGIRAEFISRFGGTTEFQGSLSSLRLGNLPLQYDLALLRVDSYNHFEAFHEDSWRAKLDLVHRLGNSLNLIYAGEAFFLKTDGSEINTGGSEKSPVLLSPGGDFVPRLGAGFLWDSRNRHHNPDRGVYQELRVTENGGWLGGPADYSEWLSDTRIYCPWLPGHTLQLSGLYQYRTGNLGETFGRYDRFHVGGVNTLRGFGNDSFRGKSEFLVDAEERMDLFRKRMMKLWKWSAYYGLQGIVGLEAGSLWDHQALLERDMHADGYVGLHVLIAGIDRIRLEVGSKFTKIQVRYDIGIMDKPDIQRFRAR